MARRWGALVAVAIGATALSVVKGLMGKRGKREAVREIDQDKHQQEINEAPAQPPYRKAVRSPERGEEGQEEESPGQSRSSVVSPGGIGISNWLQILFSGVVALFTAGLYCLSAGELEVLRDSLEQTKKNVDAAITAADAARDSVQAAKDTLNATKEHTRLDLRAWVGVQYVRLTKPPAANEKMGFTIGMNNGGKTPGLRVTLRGKISEKAPRGLESLDATRRQIGSYTAIPAGAEGYRVPILVPQNGVLSERQVALVTSGEITLYIYGVVDYEDVFGRKHFTRYCRIYVHDKEFPTLIRLCREKDYNYME